MEILIHQGVEIRYIIGKRGTKNLNARLDENGVIKVSVPYLVSKKIIEKFIIDSYFKLTKRKEKKKKNIVENEIVKIMGEDYDIKNIDNLDYLLSIKLKEYLKNNYLDICKRLEINQIPRVILKRVKGYLGQYNKKNHTITLNVLIAHLDKECIEYILIHELCHIRYMDHQDKFWSEVGKYVPAYSKVRARCKKEFIYYENY